MWRLLPFRFLVLHLAAAQIIAPTELRSGTDTFVYLGPAENRTWHLADAEGSEVSFAALPRRNSKPPVNVILTTPSKFFRVNELSRFLRLGVRYSVLICSNKSKMAICEKCRAALLREPR